MKQVQFLYQSIMTGTQYIYAAQKGLTRSVQSIKAFRVRIRVEVRTAACSFERYTTHFYLFSLMKIPVKNVNNIQKDVEYKNDL